MHENKRKRFVNNAYCMMSKVVTSDHVVIMKS